MVRWGDLTTYQGRQLLPKTKNHDLSYQDPFFTTCFQSCHSFQTRMTTTAWDEEGWRARVNYMRDTMMVGEGPRLSDEKLEDFVSYLTTAFGPSSPKPKSPEEMPQYNSLVRPFSPATMEITEFQNSPLPDGKRTGAHTIRVDERGMVWVSGGPAISMFDPKTEAFKHFDLGGTYGNVVGQNGDQWFTSFVVDGPIGRVTGDGVLTRFYPPTKGKPQRLQVDSDGIVWFSERRGGKIGRLDPKTAEFKEFPLPGPEPSPYAIGIDRNHMVWYSSHEQDTLNRMDPKTGAVTEYPYPHSEISMREFFLDSQGRMRYASSVNNKIGYFYLTSQAGEP